MNALWTLICSLPELLKLIVALQEQAKQSEKERTVRDDIKKVHEAFEKKDASLLNDIFECK